MAYHCIAKNSIVIVLFLDIDINIVIIIDIVLNIDIVIVRSIDIVLVIVINISHIVIVIDIVRITDTYKDIDIVVDIVEQPTHCITPAIVHLYLHHNE